MAKGPKLTDKSFIADKSHVKEFKDFKIEKIEKNEAKEHKDTKHEKLEKNEFKEHKDGKQEKFEKIESKEHKDAKIEKVEHKEFTKLEHGEKHPGKEKDGKELFDGPGEGNPGDPVERRLDTAGEGEAAHFISPEERPDLGGGALSGEPDRA